MATRYAVIGSGGREHAIAWKLSQEASTEVVFAIPGNVGMENDSIVCRVIDTSDLVQFCKDEGIDLVVVGPEAPLCEGLADRLRAADVPCFGPSARAAQIEGSKSFAKRVMDAAGVPTARYKSCEQIDDAIEYVRSVDHDVVIKADGLAAGKGVVLPTTRDEAVDVLRAFMEHGRFGDASKTVLIEERLHGPEVSFMVVTDGTHIVSLPTSRDHKRLLDDDAGPNTGGMGAVTPAEGVSQDDLTMMRDTMIRVVDTMREIHGGFVGFLYGGFMLTKTGPKVLEFNARLGDPETQALMIALGDVELGPLLQRAATIGLSESGNLPGTPTACVVLASEGYPDAPIKDRVVAIDELSEEDGKIFFAGVRRHEDALLSSGGRVLSAVGSGATLDGALSTAYRTLKKIHLEGGHYRLDIGR